MSILSNLVIIHTDTLNNNYAEPFDAPVNNGIFTRARQTAIADNALAEIKTAIIDIIETTSQANSVMSVPIINSLILSVTVNGQQFPLHIQVTIHNALVASIIYNLLTFSRVVPFHATNTIYNQVQNCLIVLGIQSKKLQRQSYIIIIYE